MNHNLYGGTDTMTNFIRSEGPMNIYATNVNVSSNTNYINATDIQSIWISDSNFREFENALAIDRVNIDFVPIKGSILHAKIVSCLAPVIRFGWCTHQHLGARFLPMFGLLGFDYGIGFDKDGNNLSELGDFNIILGFEPE